jgi:hypothetical protein
MLSDVLSDFLFHLYGRKSSYGEDEKDVCEALLKLQYLLLWLDCPPSMLVEGKMQEKIRGAALQVLKQERQNCTKPARSVPNFKSFVDEVMMYIADYSDCGYDEHKQSIVSALATLQFVNAKLRKLRKLGTEPSLAICMENMENRWEQAILARSTNL